MPTPYRRAINALRLGLEGAAGHYMVIVVEYLVHSLKSVDNQRILGEVSTVLGRIAEGQARRDYLYVADLLEFELSSTGLGEFQEIRSMEVRVSPSSTVKCGEPVTIGVTAKGECGEYFYVFQVSDLSTGKFCYLYSDGFKGELFWDTSGYGPGTFEFDVLVFTDGGFPDGDCPSFGDYVAENYVSRDLFDVCLTST